MTETVKARIGFVSGGSSSMPHYNSFLPLIPGEIKLEHEGLELYRESLYQIADKKETIVRRVQEFVKNKHWDAVILTAAPTEVLNPGLFDDLNVDVIRAFHDGFACMRRGPEHLFGEASASTDALR